MRKLILFSIVLIGVLMGSQVYCNSPIEVRFGIFIKKISPDFQQGTFKSEFYWWIRFKNDSNVTGIGNSEILNLEYVNGVENESGQILKEKIEDKLIGENEYYYHGFHQGDFYFNPDFTMYPFDKQKLQIAIENTLLEEQDLLILPDENSYIRSNQDVNFWGLASELINLERESFNILRSEIVNGRGEYNSDFGDPEFDPVSKYSRLDTNIYLERPFIPYISKLIIPLLIILLLVYYVFFLPPDKLDIAAGLTVTSLLSAIAFQLAIGSELPEIGYITYSDKVFYVCYFLIALSMAQSLYTFYLDASGDENKMKLAKKWDLIFRFIFPLLFFVPIVLLAF
jgi:hypothetical protein